MPAKNLRGAKPPDNDRRYLVTWEMEIDAESAQQAAAKALAIHRDEESIATVFKVFECKTGDLTEVDLQDHDDGLCDHCKRKLDEGEGIMGCPNGMEICHDCFDNGIG